LGITGFYKKIIHGYATLASPLTNLLRLPKFTWNTTAQKARLNISCQITRPTIPQKIIRSRTPEHGPGY